MAAPAADDGFPQVFQLHVADNAVRFGTAGGIKRIADGHVLFRDLSQGQSGHFLVEPSPAGRAVAADAERDRHDAIDNGEILSLSLHLEMSPLQVKRLEPAGMLTVAII